MREAIGPKAGRTAVSGCSIAFIMTGSASSRSYVPSKSRPIADMNSTVSRDQVRAESGRFVVDNREVVTGLRPPSASVSACNCPQTIHDDSPEKSEG